MIFLRSPACYESFVFHQTVIKVFLIELLIGVHGLEEDWFGSRLISLFFLYIILYLVSILVTNDWSIFRRNIFKNVVNENWKQKLFCDFIWSTYDNFIFKMFYKRIHVFLQANMTTKIMPINWQALNLTHGRLPRKKMADNSAWRFYFDIGMEN